MISFLDKYLYSLVKVHHWWSLSHYYIFSFYAQFVYMYENFVVAKITVPQGQINFFIFSFFVGFSASLELDIRGNISLQTKKVNWCGMFVPASISLLKTQALWVAVDCKKIIVEYHCVAGMILVDLETEWNGEV